MFDKLLYEIGTIDLREINENPLYQRGVNDSKCRKIAANFSWIIFGHVVVNIRENGQIVMIDGQSRSGAAMLKGEYIVPAIIVRNLSFQEEARLCAQCQEFRKPPLASERVHALLLAEDKEYINMEQILNKYSVYLKLKGKANESFRISGYTSNINLLERLYFSKGKVYFNRLFKIISSSFRQDDTKFHPEILSGLFIESVSCFLLGVKNKFTDDEIIKALKRISIDQTISNAKSNNRSYKIAIKRCMAALFLAACNKYNKSNTLINF